MGDCPASHVWPERWLSSGSKLRGCEPHREMKLVWCSPTSLANRYQDSSCQMTPVIWQIKLWWPEMGVRNSSQGTGDRQILLWAAAQASQKWVSEFWIYSGYCFAPQSQSFQQVVSSNCLWAHGHCSVIVFSDPQETDSNGSGTMSVEDFCGLSTETISLADVVNPIISNDKYIYI